MKDILLPRALPSSPCPENSATPNFQTVSKFFEIVCACWLCCGLLCSCASDRSKPANGAPQNPKHTAPSQTNSTVFVTTAIGTPLISYQWYKVTNTSAVANGWDAMYTVVAVSNGGPLYYQWQFNDTNGSGMTNR
jgi:hypothetical protein